MTIINGFKLDYQRPQPRIVKLDAAKEAQVVIAKLGNRRNRTGR